MLLFLSNCKPCEPSTAPYLSVIFKGSKTFSKVSTIDPEKVLYQDNFQSSFLLPLWIGAEKLTYVFYNGANSDTVSVSYSRKFRFNSKSCGYQYEINDLRLAKPTSFKNLVFNPFASQLEIND